MKACLDNIPLIQIQRCVTTLSFTLTLLILHLSWGTQINQLALLTHMCKVPPDRLLFGQTKSIMDTTHFPRKSSTNSRMSSTKGTDRSHRTRYYIWYLLYPSLLPPALEIFFETSNETFCCLDNVLHKGAGSWCRLPYSSMDEVSYPQPRPAILYNDNAGAVSLTKNTKGNTQVKHIDVWHHYICDLVEDGKITVCHLPSTENLADVFTKPLRRDAHHRACIGLHLTSLTWQVCRTRESVGVYGSPLDNFRYPS